MGRSRREPDQAGSHVAASHPLTPILGRLADPEENHEPGSGQHPNVALDLETPIREPAGTAGFFGSLGLPPALAYVTIAAELAGGLALILGVWARAAALALVPLLLGTIVTVHGAAGFFFNNANGGWEFPAFWIVALITQALVGDGAIALRPTPVPAATIPVAARA